LLADSFLGGMLARSTNGLALSELGEHVNLQNRCPKHVQLAQKVQLLAGSQGASSMRNAGTKTRRIESQKPFEFRCSTAIFPEDELNALNEHGARLEALAAGDVQPVTKEDRHFLLVDREEAEPTTTLERAWLRLKGRREIEEEEKSAKRPEPPEDYGMVEFDADRCWW
jgi:uncharacterized protein YifE (UPF0438 family)